MTGQWHNPIVVNLRRALVDNDVGPLKVPDKVGRAHSTRRRPLLVFV